MNLYTDAHVTIELLEEPNIMCATLMETTLFSVLNLKDAFFVTMNMIEKHPVQKIVLQSNTALLHLPETQYAYIMEVLISGIASTSIEYVANVYLEKSESELIRLGLANDLLKKMEVNLHYRNFDTRAGALAWLESVALKQAVG